MVKENQALSARDLERYRAEITEHLHMRGCNAFRVDVRSSVTDGCRVYVSLTNILNRQRVEIDQYDYDAIMSELPMVLSTAQVIEAAFNCRSAVSG